MANTPTDHATNSTSQNHDTGKQENAGFNDASISSPHELTDWVDNVLDQLESRFSMMSGQVENRSEQTLKGNRMHCHTDIFSARHSPFSERNVRAH